MHWQAWPKFLSVSCSLFLTGACGGVIVGTDQMNNELSPQQAQACRHATQQAVFQQNIIVDRIRRVHYQRIMTKQRGVSSRITGIEAWIYPKNGPGALVIVLTESCEVRRIWVQGSPVF